MKICCGIFCLLFNLLFLNGIEAVAVAPQIQTIPNQQVTQGVVYMYTPALITSADFVTWRKTYGPDDLTVNPSTGVVIWNIPLSLPGESFHIGIQASNPNGVANETWVLTVGNRSVLYAGHGEAYATIAQGVAAMNSGDTLIIRNGIYIGDSNDFINANDGGAQPTGGTENNFTTIIGEDPGMVILDGQGRISRLLQIIGNYTPTVWPDYNSKTVNRDYVALKGLEVRNSLHDGVYIAFARYVKIIDFGVSDSGRNRADCNWGQSTCGITNIRVERTDHVLLEDIYTWGHARYQVILRKGTNTVVRRGVSRIDAYIGQEPVGIVQVYCQQNSSIQNFIAIDSDSDRFWVRHEWLGASLGWASTDCGFDVDGSDLNRNNQYISSMAINNNVPFTAKNVEALADNRITNSIGWGGIVTKNSYGNGASSSFMGGEGVITADRLTLGRADTTPGYEGSPSPVIASGRAFFYQRNTPLNISNSILYQFGWDGNNTVNRGNLAWTSSQINFDHVNFYGTVNNTFSGSVSFINSITTNPTQNGLRYLPKIEPNSSLASAGIDGTRIGANIIYQHGKSGTFRDDPGWNDETTIPLWPFLHEELIKTKFADYVYSGPTRSTVANTVGANDIHLAVARGFAVANGLGLYGGPITLTSYIWEQLGYACPIDVCQRRSKPNPPVLGIR